MTQHHFLIGWAEADITPPGNALLSGQFHARVSEGVLDPLTVTALAMVSTGEGERPGSRVVMVTCDLATISDELRDAVRAIVGAADAGPDPMDLLIGATHTHTAPDVRMIPYGMGEHGEVYKRKLKAPSVGDDSGEDRFGMWPALEYGAISPADYVAFAAQRIAEAVLAAWRALRPAGIGYGLGHAVVGRNRRLSYGDGTTRVYGNASERTFRHVEGYEDHGVYTLMTYAPDGKLTGIVVNLPCPSQVSEHLYLVSADYWYETRRELRRRFGEALFILPQCAPAGDISPHVLVGKRAEERMWRLKGYDPGQNAPRQEIARRIADAVSDIEPYVRTDIDWAPRLEHTVETLHLPRRTISEDDVREALEESVPFKAQYEKLAADLTLHPERRKEPRWYHEITKAYRRMERGERVRMRLEIQKSSPTLAIEAHVFRLGETVFASSPFELYLDYAIRMRERSLAAQTFLIQKAGSNGTYLPTARSVAGRGYGSVPASTDVGPEGGEQLVEWTVDTINAMFEDTPRKTVSPLPKKKEGAHKPYS